MSLDISLTHSLTVSSKASTPAPWIFTVYEPSSSFPNPPDRFPLAELSVEWNNGHDYTCHIWAHLSYHIFILKSGAFAIIFHKCVSFIFFHSCVSIKRQSFPTGNQPIGARSDTYLLSGSGAVMRTLMLEFTLNSACAYHCDLIQRCQGGSF